MYSNTSADKKYFTQLYHQHHRSLYAYAYKKSGDQFIAEEITQTSFIKFWNHYQKTSIPPETPEKLLFFIAKALLVDHFRKRSTAISIEEALSEVESLTDQHTTQTAQVIRFEELVRTAADSLPERQKQIFEMKYFQHSKHDEIAAELNISRQTVKNLLGKAVKKVRQIAAQQFLQSFTGLL
jgi:RNA polymerase sigma-70 factor, ECF subfamily